MIEQREFRYFFGVTGATVMGSSAVVSPTTAGEVSATDDGFVLELSTVVPGGSVVALPETRIEAVAGTTSEIIVSLTRFQTTLELARSDGSTFIVLSVCETQPNELSVTTVNGSAAGVDWISDGAHRRARDSAGRSWRRRAHSRPCNDRCAESADVRCALIAPGAQSCGALEDDRKISAAGRPRSS